MKTRWLLALALASCTPGGPAAAPSVHYVVGAPYRQDGVWRYPHEQFDYDDTGLATATTRTSGHTADGEAADPAAMAAAHATLQLPAIVRVTDLDSGYQVLVRVNDRGPGPDRIIALTPRVLALLHAASPTPRVRVTSLEGESRRLAAETGGESGMRLALAAAPTADVAQEMLPPPQGAAGSAAPPPVRPAPVPVAATPPPIPLRLPETVSRVAPRPGGLFVEAAAFGHLQYAEMLSRRLAAFGAEVATSYEAPREEAYRVRIGPLADVAAADAMLHRVIGAGVPGARIVAE